MTERSSTPSAAPPTERRHEPAGASANPAIPGTVGASAPLPFLLDFFPLEDDRQTRLAQFFTALRQGRLTTTRCPTDDLLLWPPRIVCPRCHGDTLEWTDLPKTGRVYAFSAVLAGAPIGMESEVPFVVGLVDLDGAPLRLFGRIVGTSWDRCRVGTPVSVESYFLADGRVFYRFRAEA